jgi:hypothetical protein
MYGYNGAPHGGYGQGGYCAPQGGYGAPPPPPAPGGGYNGAPHGGYGQGGYCAPPELTSQPWWGGRHVMTPHLQGGHYCAPRGGGGAAPPKKDGYRGPDSWGEYVPSARTIRPGQVLCACAYG